MSKKPFKVGDKVWTAYHPLSHEEPLPAFITSMSSRGAYAEIYIPLAEEQGRGHGGRSHLRDLAKFPVNTVGYWNTPTHHLSPYDLYAGEEESWI